MLRLEQLLLLVAPEQAKSVLGEIAGQNTSFLPSRRHRGSNSAIKQSDSDIEEDEVEEGGEEAENAAFALESIAVAGRGPMVSSFFTLSP